MEVGDQGPFVGWLTMVDQAPMSNGLAQLDLGQTDAAKLNRRSARITCKVLSTQQSLDKWRTQTRLHVGYPRHCGPYRRF